MVDFFEEGKWHPRSDRTMQAELRTFDIFGFMKDLC